MLAIDSTTGSVSCDAVGCRAVLSVPMSTTEMHPVESLFQEGFACGWFCGVGAQLCPAHA